MAMSMVIEAPTDAQLDYIASLCAYRNCPTPEAVYSKAEASVIIDRLRAGTYRADDYALTYDDDDVPFQ